jgi:hypothetical protein
MEIYNFSPRTWTYDIEDRNTAEKIFNADPFFAIWLYKN